jgi:hypothetical protein
VRSAGRVVEVRKGQGTRILDGRPAEPPRPLPPPPRGLRPGVEVGYVRSGEPVELRWAASGRLYHVQLLALQGNDDQILLARDTAASSLRLSIPWLGTYRWRVTTRDARDVESPPSGFGLVCSVSR